MRWVGVWFLSLLPPWCADFAPCWAGNHSLLSGREIAVHASLGMALAPHPGAELETALDGAEELLANADAAMYRAKARGKGRYEVFEPELVQ